MNRQTFIEPNIKTIDWFDNKVIDWASAGKLFDDSGQTKELFKYTFA